VTLPNGLSVSLPSYPTAAELVANAQQALQKLKSLMRNYNAGGLTQTYIDALGIVLGSDASSLPGSTLQGAYELLNELFESAFIATATGAALRLKCADVGVFPKTATNAGGTGYFVLPAPAGSSGVIYPAGSILAYESADPTQPPILYTTLAAATALSGQSVTNAIAYNAIATGSAGNIPNPAVMAVQTGGVGTFQAAGPTIGGTDDESDDSLRSRGLEAIPNASQCTDTAIQADALSYAGITSAVLLDDTNDDGLTFIRGISQLYVDDGSGNLQTLVNSGDPNIQALQSVKSYKQLQSDLNTGKYRAAGAQVHLNGSLTLNATIAISIDVAQSYITLGGSTAAMVLGVQNALLAFANFLTLAHPLTIASIIQTAKEAKDATGLAGVSNVLVSSILINGSNADLTPLAQQVIRCANLGAITVTVNAITPYA
jgi:hypothetical protein